MRRRRLPPILAALALLSAGCLDAGPGADLRDRVERNRERWLDLRPSDYRYELRRSCFCPVEYLGPVTLRVVDGQVVEAHYTETGVPVDAGTADAFPSVDGLFDVLLDALDRDADRIDVDFDEDTGIPLEFFIDYEQNAADEELGYRVVGLPVASG